MNNEPKGKPKKKRKKKKGQEEMQQVGSGGGPSLGNRSGACASESGHEAAACSNANIKDDDIELNWESFEEKTDSSEKEYSGEEDMSSWDFVLSDAAASFHGSVGNPRISVQVYTRNHLRTLDHVCQQDNANCPVLNCQKLKRKVDHLKNCIERECPVCNNFVASCISHSSHCLELECPTPYCLQIKLKMRQRQNLVDD